MQVKNQRLASIYYSSFPHNQGTNKFWVFCSNSLKSMPSFHRALISGTFSWWMWTRSGSTPLGTLILSSLLGSMKTPNVFLEMFFPAISLLFTTEWGVASKWPPVKIWVDSPNWNASMSSGILTPTASENLFLQSSPPLSVWGTNSLPYASK